MIPSASSSATTASGCIITSPITVINRTATIAPAIAGVFDFSFGWIVFAAPDVVLGPNALIGLFTTCVWRSGGGPTGCWWWLPALIGLCVVSCSPVPSMSNSSSKSSPSKYCPSSSGLGAGAGTAVPARWLFCSRFRRSSAAGSAKTSGGGPDGAWTPGGGPGGGLASPLACCF